MIPSFPRSAWERTPGRSASRLSRNRTRRRALHPRVPTQSVETRALSHEIPPLGVPLSRIPDKKAFRRPTPAARRTYSFL